MTTETDATPKARLTLSEAFDWSVLIIGAVSLSTAILGTILTETPTVTAENSPAVIEETAG